MLHSLLKIADIPVTIRVGLNALSVWKIVAPVTLVNHVIISKFSLSRNTIGVNAPNKIRAIGINKIIFLSVTIALCKNSN